jgi:hypothetical protein
VRGVATTFCLAAALGFWGSPFAATGEEAGHKEEPAERAEDRQDDRDVDRAAKVASDQDVPPKLSFTDEDLKKYHRPKDGKEDAAVLDGIDEEGTLPPPPQGAPLVRTPLDIARPPADDPLKEYKDREAREKFRAQQLQTLRDRIAGLEKRLAYLQQKRLAIVDPLRIMPQPQNPDETARDAALGSGELLAAVEEEIESTEAQLNSARENLVTIQTRFGAESR